MLALAKGSSPARSCPGGDDIVAQLGVGQATFWVAPTSSSMKRLSPRAPPAGRFCWSRKPAALVRQAMAAGARQSSPVQSSLQDTSPSSHSSAGSTSRAVCASSSRLAGQLAAST